MNCLSSVRNRLNSNVISSLRRVVGRVSDFRNFYPKKEVISWKILKLKSIMKHLVLVLRVVDVRIRRADLPEANSQAIYERMISERVREAKEFRAKGSEDCTKN